MQVRNKHSPHSSLIFVLCIDKCSLVYICAETNKSTGVIEQTHTANPIVMPSFLVVCLDIPWLLSFYGLSMQVSVLLRSLGPNFAPPVWWGQRVVRASELVGRVDAQTCGAWNPAFVVTNLQNAGLQQTVSAGMLQQSLLFRRSMFVCCTSKDKQGQELAGVWVQNGPQGSANCLRWKWTKQSLQHPTAWSSVGFWTFSIVWESRTSRNLFLPSALLLGIVGGMSLSCPFETQGKQLTMKANTLFQY